MDDSHESSQYDMIIGRDLLLEIKLDLCFSNYTIKGSVGVYEGSTTPMRDTCYLWGDVIFRN